MALGRIYEQGIAVKQDISKALAYYDHAAQDMEPYAIYKIGYFLEEGVHPDCNNRKPNREQAFQYYSEAFTQGEFQNQASREALFKRGQYFQFGFGVSERNFQQAIKNYDLAAADGHVESMNALGSLYFKDLREYEQASQWFKKASDRGYTRAINNLGICYEFGYGVEKDFNEALLLYEEGAIKGHVQSMYNLAYLYFQLALENSTIGERKSPQIRHNEQFKLASHWFRKCLLKIDSINA